MTSIRGYLLTPSQMADKYHQLNETNFEFPYFFKISKTNQMLFFIGFQHSYDPLDAQFVHLEKYWNDFLNLTSKHNCLVLNEGGKRRSESNKQLAIQSGGESSYITYLAEAAGVAFESPEPDPKNEAQLLLKKFAQSDIANYYFARTVNQWQRLNPRPNASEYLQRFLNAYKKELYWTDFNFSLEHLSAIHTQVHDHKFDSSTCIKCIKSDSNPIENPVSAESSAIRDEHITEQILNYWDQGQSIFAVFGSGHAITIEPALFKLLSPASATQN